MPKGTLNVYKEADGWKLFTDIVEIGLTVSTSTIFDIQLSSALLKGKIELMDTPISSHGFCWNTTGNPTINDNKIDKGTATVLGIYDYTVTNLTAGTTYFVRAYATDDEETIYGDEISFTTASLPSVAGTISGTTTVCQGQSSVTYTVPNINYATSYIWTLPTGATGTSSTNSITVNYAKTSISGNITVKGHNQWGDGTISSLEITANLLPLNAGIISGETSVCQGETSVNYSVPSIDHATSYTWTLPTGATGTSTTNSINVHFSKSALSGNITVKGHNDCGDGVVSTLPIKVNQLPVITVADKTIICGGTAQLNSVTSNYSGIGTLKYKWTPSTGLNNDSIANPVATVITNTNYTVTVTTPNGCTASDNILVTITSMAKPEIGIVGIINNKNRVVWNKLVSTGISSFNIYKETTVSDVYEKVGSVSYDSLSLFIDNQSAPDVKSNKYRLSILDRCGFESPQSNAHKTMHLSINRGQNNAWNLIWEPYEGFAVSTYNIYRGTTPNSLNFLDATSGSNTQYSDISAPSGDVFYQLEIISPTLVNPSQVKSPFKKVIESESAVIVSYNNSRSNIVSNLNNSNNESDNIHVFPNPVKDQLKIDFEGGATFEILNLMGQVVYEGDLIENSIVQTSFLPTGVYMIKFKTSKTFEYRKIIKE